MKTSHLISLSLIAALIGFGLLAGNAISGAPRSTSTPAAVASGSAPVMVAIDLTKILKEDNFFKEQMEGMAAEIKTAEVTLNAERDAIVKVEDQLRGLKSGSPDYKQLEDSLIKRKSDFNVKASVQKKDLMEKETRIYYTIYKEVTDEVKAFAEYYKISIVLRYNSEVADGSTREGVAREMAKPIVYLGPNLDITDQIVSSINRRHPAKVANGLNGPVRNQK
ncbi:MAG TPA: OmpH family outer membrane protein [Pirellulales bacterium]|nr:OmpH family outer membrane protein [Pirellulales bacterium]